MTFDCQVRKLRQVLVLILSLIIISPEANAASKCPTEAELQMVKAAIQKMAAERAAEEATLATAKTAVTRSMYGTAANLAAKEAVKVSEQRLAHIVAQEAMAISQAARLRAGLIGIAECSVALSCTIVENAVKVGGVVLTWATLARVSDAAETYPIIETKVEECISFQEDYFKNKRYYEAFSKKIMQLEYDYYLRKVSLAYYKGRLASLTQARLDAAEDMSWAENDFYDCVGRLDPIIWEEARGDGTVCKGTKVKTGKIYEDIKIQCSVRKDPEYLTDSCNIVPPKPPTKKSRKDRDD